MEDLSYVFQDFRSNFDFERIRALAVPEKFKLANLCHFLYYEARYAQQHGVSKLNMSPNYNLNKTYRLIAMLASDGVKYDFLMRMAKNYCRTFDKSDIYYSHMAMTSMGIMMIVKGFKPLAVHNFLIHILGREFLIDNARFSGLAPKDFQLDPNSLPEIQYKPYEGDMRKIKYELLALIKYTQTHGRAKTEALINNGYPNDSIRFYFNMLNIIDDDCTKLHIYETYEKGTSSRTERVKLNGCMAMLSGADIYTIHYLLNSIVGKYTSLELKQGEIEEEVNDILNKKILPMEPQTK